MARQAWVQIQDHCLASLSLSLFIHQMGSLAAPFDGFPEDWLGHVWCTVGAQPPWLFSEQQRPAQLWASPASSGLHLWGTSPLFRDRLPQAAGPLERATARECGWGPRGRPCPQPPAAAGQRPQCGAAGVLSRAQTHDWTSENAAHYPTHRAQRPTRGLGRPGARGGCMGAPGPHPRGQGCAQSRERVSLTRRKESHFLQPLGETKTERSGQGACHRRGWAPLGSPDTRPRSLPAPSPPCHPLQGIHPGGWNAPEPWKRSTPWSSPELAVGRHPPNLPSSTRGL